MENLEPSPAPKFFWKSEIVFDMLQDINCKHYVKKHVGLCCQIIEAEMHSVTLLALAEFVSLRRHLVTKELGLRECGLELRKDPAVPTADLVNSVRVDTMLFQHGANLLSFPRAVLDMPSRIIGLVRSV